MLLQLEQECLNVYKRKVDQAVKSKAHLLQALADAKLEFSTLVASLGEKSFDTIPDKTSGTIKELLAAIALALEQLWVKKEERKKEFLDVQTQIQKICGEIAGSNERVPSVTVDESDLSLKKLKEFHDRLQELQNEKSQRLNKVLEFVNDIHDICGVLGIDFYSTVKDVHPSLIDATGAQSKSISNDTLAKLAKTVKALLEVKKQRLQKFQDLAAQLTVLWNLMDTSEEKRSLFDHVTCNISAASVDNVTAPGALALYLIEQADVEVERLNQLKGSRMKEISLKRQGKLEEIFASEKEHVSEPESEEDSSKKRKRGSNKAKYSKKDPGVKSKEKKVVNSPKKTSSAQIKTPVISSTSGTKAKDQTDSGTKTFSRKNKKKGAIEEKHVTPKKAAPNEKTGKKTLKEKEKPKSEKLNISDNDLRTVICEILKEVDFNTATINDILKQLARRFNRDLSSRKVSIGLMIKEELTKIVDEEEPEMSGKQASGQGVKA